MLAWMRTVGDRLQDDTWSHVVEKTVQISGGTAPSGVEHETTSLDEDEAKAIETWVEEMVLRRKRAENAEALNG